MAAATAGGEKGGVATSWVIWLRLAGMTRPRPSEVVGRVGVVTDEPAAAASAAVGNAVAESVLMEQVMTGWKAMPASWCRWCVPGATCCSAEVCVQRSWVAVTGVAENGEEVMALLPCCCCGRRSESDLVGRAGAGCALPLPLLLLLLLPTSVTPPTGRPRVSKVPVLGCAASGRLYGAAAALARWREGVCPVTTGSTHEPQLPVGLLRVWLPGPVSTLST